MADQTHNVIHTVRDKHKDHGASLVLSMLQNKPVL